MELLLGSLLLGGVCWLGAAMDFSSMPKLNNQRVAGNWNPLANILIDLRSPLFTLKAERKRGLMYSFKYPDKNKCQKKKFQLTEHGGRGKFKASSPVLIQVLDTDYTTYIISYIERPMGSFLQLAGRETTLTPELEKKFKEFATSKGVTGEVITVVPTESC